MNKIKHQNSVIGLDINSERIVAVLLKAKQAELCVTRLASVRMPAGALEDGCIVKPKTVGLTIKEMIAANGFNVRETIVGCGDVGSILHLIELPPMSDTQTRQAVKNQLSKFVVFAGHDVVSDYYIIEKISATKNKILIVAAKKNILDSYVAAVEEAGLYLLGIDENSLAVTRLVYDSFFKETPSGAVIISVIGLESTSVSIYLDGQLYYVHKLDQGVRAGEDINEFINDFCFELNNMFQYYKTKNPQKRGIRKVLLAGEVEEIGRLDKTIKQKIKADEEFALIITDHLKDVRFDKDDVGDKMEGRYQTLCRSVGLAMRGMGLGAFAVKIDLLPPEVIKMRFLEKRLKFWAVFAIMVVIGLAALLTGVQLEIKNVKKQIAAIEQKSESTPQTQRDLIGLEQEYKKNMNEIEFQNAIIGNLEIFSWHEILGELSQIIPKDARLIDLNASQSGQISLSGEAANQEAVFNFEKVLNESPYFKDVNLGIVEGRQGAKGYVRFTLSCQLRTEEK